ncbi:MAG: hypothetical protein DLM62_03595 [Pseudonocardiales bacterium]|nr:MAG: hypothetical protein DLM62_03595 [Pseudonocardiales bacterium]
MTTLDPKPALVVIDVQKGITAVPGVPALDDVIQRSAGLAAAFRGHGLPIVLVTSPAPADPAITPARPVAVGQCRVLAAPQAQVRHLGRGAGVGRLEAEPGEEALHGRPVPQMQLDRRVRVHVLPALYRDRGHAVRGGVGQREVAAGRERAQVPAYQPPGVRTVRDEVHDAGHDQADRLAEVDEPGQRRLRQ